MPNLITPAQAASFKASSKDAAFAARFISLFTAGSSTLVKNVQTTMLGLVLGKNLFPITVNETEYPNSYVTSPFTHYITYAIEELPNLRNPALIFACRILLNTLSSVLRWGQLNRNVHINNWLLSTNLYPAIQPGELTGATKFLQNHYPNHALIWRSLNRRQHAQLMEELESQGYKFFFSRQVYLYEGTAPTFLNRQNNRWDARLLRESAYSAVSHEDLVPEDFPRINHLYNLLYIDKYTAHNPQFETEYLKLCWEKNLLTFQGLRHKQTGSLDGIIGYFNRNGTMTTPIVGYETSLPQQTGLYRMLISLILQKAVEEKWFINLSAGAAQFKRVRGGEAELEYSAIKYDHLPFRRRLAWHTLYFILNHLAIPLMQRHRL